MTRQVSIEGSRMMITRSVTNSGNALAAKLRRAFELAPPPLAPPPRLMVSNIYVTFVMLVQGWWKQSGQTGFGLPVFYLALVNSTMLAILLLQAHGGTFMLHSSCLSKAGGSSQPRQALS